MPFWGLFAQKKCKNVISDPKNGRHVPRSRLFEVRFADEVPLPTFVDWEKSAKKFLFKMAALLQNFEQLAQAHSLEGTLPAVF